MPAPQKHSLGLSPSGLLKFLANINYQLQNTVADLIDNSIDAGAKKIKMIFDYDHDTNSNPYLIIADDGSGITDWDAMVKIGGDNKHESEDLGHYGVGAKVSTLSQAGEVSYYSKPKGSELSMRRISRSEILAIDELFTLPYPYENSTIPEGTVERIIEEEGYTTVVIMEDMHRINLNVAHDKNPSKIIKENFDVIRVHTGITFQRFIEKKGLKITLSGSDVEAIDPFHMHSQKTNTGKWHGTIVTEENLEVGNYHIPIKMHVIPHEHRNDDTSKKIEKDILKLGVKRSSRQGLYFYHNDRLICFRKQWHGIYETDSHLSCARCSIEIPKDGHEIFRISPYKLDCSPLDTILNALGDEFKEKRPWSGLWIEPYYKNRPYLSTVKSKTTPNVGVAVCRNDGEGGAIKVPLTNDQPHPKATDDALKCMGPLCDGRVLTEGESINAEGWCERCVKESVPEEQLEKCDICKLFIEGANIIPFTHEGFDFKQAHEDCITDFLESIQPPPYTTPSLQEKKIEFEEIDGSDDDVILKFKKGDETKKELVDEIRRRLNLN